jgi:hypothetical protein
LAQLATARGLQARALLGAILKALAQAVLARVLVRRTGLLHPACMQARQVAALQSRLRHRAAGLLRHLQAARPLCSSRQAILPCQLPAPVRI